MNRLSAWGVGLVVLAFGAACGGDREGTTPGGMTQRTANPSGDEVTLIGAGATFPYPVYSAWFSEYSEQNPVRVNYQSIGSGGGIRQLMEGTVDFGASDAPMTEDELAEAPGTLHLPTVIGAVAATYNLPSLTEPIRLDGPTLAGIFLGDITEWNDPRIQQLNPGAALPDRPILVVYRTDGSGTTYIFTEYLASVSPEWREQVGYGKAVRWPVGLGGKGNEGVAGQVTQTEGAIGYVEQVYARQSDLPTAAIENRSGNFVQPTLAATSAAADGIAEQIGPDGDFRISIVNAEGAEAYPITAWTYLLIPPHFENCTKARALYNLYGWTQTEGVDMARELGYAPIPPSVREQALDRWSTVTCGPDREPVETERAAVPEEPVTETAAGAELASEREMV